MENVNDNKSKEQMEDYKSGFDYLNDVPVPLPNKSDNLKLIKADELEEEPINNILEGIFIPTWDNEPPPRKPILSLNGVGILRYQNISCILASPGSGKSSICESIISSVINKDCDSLGFKSSVDSVLMIDFERAQEDVHTSFRRTMRRAEVKQGDTINSPEPIISLRNISNAKDRKAGIELLLSQRKPELLLLDGIGDLVDDTNSLEQAIECKNWVRYITSKFGVSILTTLHPNKGTLTARGHIGSEISMREAEGALAITVDDNELRTLTSKFENGKARNGGHATSYFKWSDEQGMFVTCHKEVSSAGRPKLEPLENLSEDEIWELLYCSHGGLKHNYTYSLKVLRENIQVQFPNRVNNVVAIRGFLKFLVDNEYMIKAKDGKSTLYSVNDTDNNKTIKNLEL